MVTGKKGKIAFLHRYGLGGWLCCGGHAVPRLVELLAESSELHFFGPSSSEPVPPEILGRISMHPLPWGFDRSDPRATRINALRFYVALPWIGLRCRKMGVDFVYWEETLPLGSLILQLFYGRRIAIMVMDFFVRIYTEKRRWLYGVRDLVERIDCWSWRKLPLLFVHVETARTFLVERGVGGDRVQVVANPCNHAVFKPVDQVMRRDIRQRFGFTDRDVVMTHHGILHPNKGNDWVLRRLAEVRQDLPDLKFLLLGNGPEMENVVGLVTELGLQSCVTLAGWLPSEADLSSTLAAMDIGLVMRIGQETDHFHMTDTLNHEMACGKPILAVHLRGVAEFVEDGMNGYLFPAEAPDVFCKRLKQLVENPLERETLGKAALDTSLRVSAIDTCAQRMAVAILGA